jgi:hypothetical protein
MIVRHIRTLRDLGEELAEAIEAGDRDRLEQACLYAGCYTIVRRAASVVGIEPAVLEEALATIS